MEINLSEYNGSNVKERDAYIYASLNLQAIKHLNSSPSLREQLVFVKPGVFADIICVLVQELLRNNGLFYSNLTSDQELNDGTDEDLLEMGAFFEAYQDAWSGEDADAYLAVYRRRVGGLLNLIGTKYRDRFEDHSELDSYLNLANELATYLSPTSSAGYPDDDHCIL